MQFADLLLASGRQHFHVSIRCVAHPSAQADFERLVLHKPAKAHSLHATF